jgi:hypothetical protein
METLILLARFKPLPRSFDLKKAFEGFPKQPFQNDRSVVWLDGGEISKGVERAPLFFNPEQINDPVLITQRLITERLKSHFPLIRAVSFANSVDAIQ